MYGFVSVEILLKYRKAQKRTGSTVSEKLLKGSVFASEKIFET